MTKSRKTPAGRPEGKKSVPKISQKTDDRGHFYRCPACGELVDGRERETVARHHRHVLFPRQPDPPAKRPPK